MKTTQIATVLALLVFATVVAWKFFERYYTLLQSLDYIF